jgi:hypothetical protein
VFPAAPPAAGGFEVVDDEPASPPPPPRPAAKSVVAAKTAPPPPPAKNEFEFDDAPKKKRRDEDDEDDRPRSRRRDEDDEDDDRPRKRRRDDDEDEDDRPRSRRRRDDDEDEDDRPRRRGRRRYEDDEDEDWRPAARGKPGFGPARTGALLLNISFWLYFASLALISLLIFLGWVATSTLTGGGGGGGRPGRGGDDGEWILTLIKLPGILGLANWVVALVGFGFCIAGPARARGMAITATVFAAVHFLLLLLTYNNLDRAIGIPLAADAVTWPLFASALLGVDILLPTLVIPRGTQAIGTNFMLFFAAGVCEVLRLVFALMTVKELARAGKDYGPEEKAHFGVIAAVSVVGASALLALLLAVLGRMEVIRGPNIIIGSLLLMYLGFTAMTIFPTLATHGVRNSLYRKAR